MHLAVYSANLKPESLNCSLVLCMFGSLISCCQKSMERGMRLIMLLGCQEKLAYCKPCLSVCSRQLSRCLGMKRFWSYRRGTELGPLFQGSCFFSICKTGFILQTHYLQQACSLRSCFLQQAYQGSVFWLRQCVQQRGVIHQPPLKLCLNNVGKNWISFDSIVTGRLQSTEAR